MGDHAGHDQPSQDAVARSPELALRSEPQIRFQQERITEQRDQTSQIARRIEKVRVAGRRMPGLRKPSLQQRSAREMTKRANRRFSEGTPRATRRIGLIGEDRTEASETQWHANAVAVSRAKCTAHWVGDWQFRPDARQHSQRATFRKTMQVVQTARVPPSSGSSSWPGSAERKRKRGMTKIVAANNAENPFPADGVAPLSCAQERRTR